MYIKRYLFPSAAGHGCTAYDVVINPELYTRALNSQIMMGFFLTVVIEGLEYKYSISLDRSKNLNQD